MPQDLASDLLRSTIEDAVGRKLRTPKDFGFLADLIFEKLHEHISPTTLKRFWGYLHDASSTPRQSTLDLLAQFIDYPSFATFAEAHTTTAAEAQATATAEPQPTPSPAAPQTAVGDAISATSSHYTTFTPPIRNRPHPPTPPFRPLHQITTHPPQPVQPIIPHPAQPLPIPPAEPHSSLSFLHSSLIIRHSSFFSPFSPSSSPSPSTTSVPLSPTSYISAPNSPATTTISSASASSPISTSPTTHATQSIPIYTSGVLNTTTPCGTTMAIQQP